MPMRRSALVFAVFLAARALAAQTVPELFQKGKEQAKAGAWTEALGTFASLETLAAQPANEGVRKQLEGPLAFYRGVCEANLDRKEKAVADFRVFLRGQPDASIDEALYSPKAVAAFDVAVRSNPGSVPPLTRAYKAFQPPAQGNEPVTAAWADGPVVWLMGDPEKAAWSHLKTDPERTVFVEKFWRARDSDTDHSFRPTFERRVAFADAKLQDAGDKTRGSMTDRGMIFVLFGSPTEDAVVMLRVPGQIAGQASKHSSPALVGTWTEEEVWKYKEVVLANGDAYQNVEVWFDPNTGRGAHQLQRSVGGAYNGTGDLVRQSPGTKLDLILIAATKTRA
jgi:GWxTD domain-containing protein